MTVVEIRERAAAAQARVTEAESRGDWDQAAADEVRECCELYRDWTGEMLWG